MGSVAQLSVRFKAFDHNCLVRAQKQLQGALSLCRPVTEISEEASSVDAASSSQSQSQASEGEPSLHVRGFGLLDANPKVSQEQAIPEIVLADARHGGLYRYQQASKHLAVVQCFCYRLLGPCICLELRYMTGCTVDQAVVLRSQIHSYTVRGL